MVEILQDLIGLTYEVDVVEQEILRLAGTNDVRIYSNQMMVTTDFIETRLNVIYDHKTKEILSVTYG